MQWLIIAGIVVIGLLALSVLFRIFKAVAGIAVLVLVIWLCFHFIHGFTVNALLKDFKNRGRVCEKRGSESLRRCYHHQLDRSEGTRRESLAPLRGKSGLQGD